MIASMAEGGSSRMAWCFRRCPLPQECRGQDPRSPAQGRPDRSGHRPRTQPPLRHRPQRLREYTSSNKPAERKNKVLIIDAQEPFRKGRAQNSRPGTRRTSRRVVPGVRRCRRSGQGRQPRRDQREGGRSTYPLRPAAHWRGHSALPEAVAAFKDALTDARIAEDHLRTVLTEGGWLND